MLKSQLASQQSTKSISHRFHARGSLKCQPSRSPYPRGARAIRGMIFQYKQRNETWINSPQLLSVGCLFHPINCQPTPVWRETWKAAPYIVWWYPGCSHSDSGLHKSCHLSNTRRQAEHRRWKPQKPDVNSNYYALIDWTGGLDGKIFWERKRKGIESRESYFMLKLKRKTLSNIKCKNYKIFAFLDISL